MCRQLLLFLLLHLLVVICTGSGSNKAPRNAEYPSATSILSSDQPKVRARRGIFWNFIQNVLTTKNLIVDQYVDTKNTLSTVYNLMNEVFSDPEPPKPTILPATTETTKSSTDSGNEDLKATTTEDYQISRYEFGRLLGRNYRGLRRLTNNELERALNQSKYNVEEYKTEARKQFANSLAMDMKNNFKKGP